MVFQKSLQGLVLEEKATACPDCRNEDIELMQGERFCRKCGLVME